MYANRNSHAKFYANTNIHCYKHTYINADQNIYSNSVVYLHRKLHSHSVADKYAICREPHRYAYSYHDRNYKPDINGGCQYTVVYIYRNTNLYINTDADQYVHINSFAGYIYGYTHVHHDTNTAARRDSDIYANTAK